MEIKIAGHTISLYHECQLNLKYDAVASHFSFALYFDPENDTHRRIFHPLQYQKCTIEHGGVLLLTGVVLSHAFSSAGNPPRQLVNIKGYSLPGCLEDCVPIVTPLEVNGLKAIDIVNKLTKHYQDKWGFRVKVDPEVAEVVNTVMTISNPEPDEPVAHFLDKMLSQLNVVLSHDRFGNVVLTKVKNDKLLTTTTTQVKQGTPGFTNEIEGLGDFVNEEVTTTTASNRATLYDFTQKGQWTGMTTVFDGQRMHTDIVVISQDDVNAGNNAIECSPLSNPYVVIRNSGSNVFDQGNSTADTRGARPLTVIQSNQTANADNAAPRTARSVLGDELKSITAAIETDRWVLNGNIITPNQMITAKNPEVYLYSSTKLFVQEVVLKGDKVRQTAVLTCVPPSAFGDGEVETII